MSRVLYQCSTLRASSTVGSGSDRRTREGAQRSLRPHRRGGDGWDKSEVKVSPPTPTLETSGTNVETVHPHWFTVKFSVSGFLHPTDSVRTRG